MKTFGISVRIYVQGDDEQEAVDNLVNDLDEMVRSDTSLRGFDHPEWLEAELVQEDE